MRPSTRLDSQLHDFGLEVQISLTEPLIFKYVNNEPWTGSVIDALDLQDQLRPRSRTSHVVERDPCIESEPPAAPHKPASVQTRHARRRTPEGRAPAPMHSIAAPMIFLLRPDLGTHLLCVLCASAPLRFEVGARSTSRAMAASAQPGPILVAQLAQEPHLQPPAVDVLSKSSRYLQCRRTTRLDGRAHAQLATPGSGAALSPCTSITKMPIAAGGCAPARRWRSGTELHAQPVAAHHPSAHAVGRPAPCRAIQVARRQPLPNRRARHTHCVHRAQCPSAPLRICQPGPRQQVEIPAAGRRSGNRPHQQPALPPTRAPGALTNSSAAMRAKS